MEEESNLTVAEQLKQALSKNAGRVIDLFREWDTDGDGQVSKKEFRRAMPMLGLDVPKADIDALFDEFDKDGGGQIGYQEMKKLLSSGPGSSSAAAAVRAPHHQQPLSPWVNSSSV